VSREPALSGAERDPVTARDASPWRVARTEHTYRDFPTREAADEFAKRVRVYGPVTVCPAPADDRAAPKRGRTR
jgi:hypothetical protein